MNDLRDCPFCGAKARQFDIEIGEEQTFQNEGGSVIECSNCRCSTRVFFGRKEGLRGAWNARPDAREPSVQSIEDILSDCVDEGTFEYGTNSNAVIYTMALALHKVFNKPSAPDYNAGIEAAAKWVEDRRVKHLKACQGGNYHQVCADVYARCAEGIHALIEGEIK